MGRIAWFDKGSLVYHGIFFFPFQNDTETGLIRMDMTVDEKRPCYFYDHGAMYNVEKSPCVTSVCISEELCIVLGGRQESDPQAPKVCDRKYLEKQLAKKKKKEMKENCEVNMT